MACTGWECGIGGSPGPLPGDPDNNSVLTATPAFGGIDVSWSFPELNSHAVAHTILYRGLSSDFSTAVRRAVVDGNYFFDRIEENLTLERFYWIQIVSINGTVGELIGPASSLPRGMIDQVITELTGRIDAGVLAQSLKTEIDKITLNGQDLFTEIQDRITQGNTLGASIQQAQDGVNSALTFLTTEITQRTEADSALLQQVNVLATSVNDNTAAILSELTARVSADDALASQITTVQAEAAGNLASAQTTLQTNINTVDGKVTDIGALYTAKVTVNGLVGGFGIYNNGSEVQAGFDVDTFWVGRTSTDKKKPFIIQDGEVFIDNAVIHQLTADKIDTRGLSIKDIDGNVILSAGISLDWSRIGNKTGFAEISQLTGANVSTYIANAAIGNAQIGGDLWSTNYVAGTSGWIIERGGYAEFSNVKVRGDVQATSLSAATGTFSGTLTAGAINAVDTINLAGNAVTVPVVAYTAAPVNITYGGDAWIDMQSGYIDTGGATQIISFAIVFKNTSGVYSGNLSWRLLSPSSGVLVTDNVALSPDETIGVSHMVSSTETGTFKLQAKAIDLPYLDGQNRTLSLFGAKR